MFTFQVLLFTFIDYLLRYCEDPTEHHYHLIPQFSMGFVKNFLMVLQLFLRFKHRTFYKNLWKNHCWIPKAFELFHVPWNECILEINFEELFPARRFAQIAK